MKRAKFFTLLLTLALSLCLILTACGADSGNENPDDHVDGYSKVLVVYFSATSNTERIAQHIADSLNGELFEILPADDYSSPDLNWSDQSSRVVSEHNAYLAGELEDVALESTSVPDWDSYDTVFIGYPIWWGIAAWPVNTFVKANDFEGKTVIPFCTSSSSGLGDSANNLKDMANGGEWLGGNRFSSGASNSTVDNWLKGLGFEF